MTVASLLILFENIGSIVGIIITLITFFTIVSKRPLNALRRMVKEENEKANEIIRKENNEANKKVEQQLDKIQDKIKENDSVDLAILRNTITHIYFKYKDEKVIPHYEKENVMSLFEQYEKKKGNSYVHNIVDEMRGWDEKL